MLWKECANCGRTRAYGSEPPEPVFCGMKCQKNYRQKEAALNPVNGRRSRSGRRSTTARSKRFAAELTQQVGGKIVTGSGAVQGYDGDRVFEHTLVEEKTTTKNSYLLSTDTWEKLLVEASRAGKNAALILQLGPHKIIMMPLAEAIERVGDL